MRCVEKNRIGSYRKEEKGAIEDEKISLLKRSEGFKG